MIKDATYYAQLIKTGQLSPSELLTETLKRAHKMEALNAFVELNPELAFAQLNQKMLSSANQPFYGVPFALKDLGQAKKGFKQTVGSRLFREVRANETNHYVQKIETAGFIPFGVTTSPEYGFKNITDATIYGPTRNAWNLDYFSGGSSGGAASVVASGISPIAGASDGGGSIRIPASFSGLIGLKPSRGAISNGPNSWRDWQGASVNFVLGVSMRDMATLLPLMAPDSQISPFIMPRPRLPKENRPLKIAVCWESPIGNPVSEDAKMAVKNAVKFLEKAGHSVELIDYPINGTQLIRSYYQMNGGETASMMADISQALNRPLTRQDMELMTWTIYQYGLKLSAADYVSSFQVWDDATAIMETLFDDYDLFLSPTATTTAPLITTDLQSDKIRQAMLGAAELTKLELAELVYNMFEKSLWLTPYTQLANLTGQPAISLPTHIADNGLPIGIQLMAAKGNDQLLIDVGQAFEADHQFKLPPFYKKINL
ncbi:amidase [Vagococcus penaei]|nr:amidase [Vagococcus penaei]